MSWIRSFRDLSSNQNNNRESRRLIQNSSRNERYPILGEGSGLGTPDQARNENFWLMLQIAFCPSFKSKSFIFGITCLQTLIYFITVVYDYDSNRFIKPTSHSLDIFGDKNSEKMKEDYQL